MKKILFVMALIFFGVFFFTQVAQASTAGERILSRPEKNKGPTEVECAVWLVDIDSIDSSAQTFIANVFVSYKWKDPLLTHGGEGYVAYPLNEIWNPGAQLINEIGLVRKTLPEIATVDPEGYVTYKQRYIGPFSQPLQLQKFPFDRQSFTIHFVSTAYSPDEIHFVQNRTWLENGIAKAGGIAPDISLPDWKLLNYETMALPYVLAPKIQKAGYAFEFLAQRDVTHYIWKVFLPLLLIVAMSWSVFWIDPSNSGTQIGVATTSMLTLIAYRFAIDSQVPRVPYMTKLDQFIVAGTVLIFLSLTQVILTSWLAHSDRQTLAIKIDKVSRYVFPIFFVVALTVSLIA